MTSSVVAYHVTCMMLVTLGTRITGNTAQTMDTNPDFPTHIVSSCLPLSGDATLNLSCPTAGQLVKLVTLFYGHGDSAADDVISAASITDPSLVGPSRDNVQTGRTSHSLNPTARCQYAPRDCVTHLPSNTESISCVGHRRCSIFLAATDRGKMIPGCQLTATYAQAVYQCIPESTIVDVCNRAERLKSTSGSGSGSSSLSHPPIRGYLRTPFYPDAYPDNVDCNVTIEAAETGQRVRLFVVDMALETNGTGCADWLQVFDGAKSATLCGFRARSWLAGSSHAFINVRLVTNERRQLKGFWLYYEVVPHSNVTVQIAPTSFAAPVTSSFSTSLSISPSVIVSRDLAVATGRMTSSASSVGTFPLVSAASYPFPTVAAGLVAVVFVLFITVITILVVVVVLLVRRKTRLNNATAINYSSHTSPSSPTSSPAAAAAPFTQFPDGPVNNVNTASPHRIFTVESSPKSNAEKWHKNRLHSQQQQKQQSAPKCTNVYVDYSHSPGGARNSGAKRRDGVVEMKDSGNRCYVEPKSKFLQPHIGGTNADDPAHQTVWSTRNDCNDFNGKPSLNCSNGLYV